MTVAAIQYVVPSTVNVGGSLCALAFTTGDNVGALLSCTVSYQVLQRHDDFNKRESCQYHIDALVTLADFTPIIRQKQLSIILCSH